jgi:hypothetical protein
MAVKYDDNDGGYTPPKPPKPVTYPWQQTPTPKPVTYASTPTPQPQQTPRPASTPTPPGSNPLTNILGAVNNWIWRNNPQKVNPTQIRSPYPTFSAWAWRNNPQRFNPNNSLGRAQLQNYASSGPSYDPRNNPAFWRSAPSSNSTTTGGLDLAKLSQIANNPNANNTELRYFYNPYQYVQNSGINGVKQPAPSMDYGNGWGYGGGGGGGYTPNPYLPQWYLNTGLWRI